MQENDTTPGDGGKPGGPGLLEHHRAELTASLIIDETIGANNIHSESDPEAVAKLLNWSVGRAKQLGPVLVYPHFDRDGRPTGHATVKPDRPRDRKDKPGTIKYENPRGKPNCVYVPAGSRAALADPVADILLTEGIKKALAATQSGFPCLSIPGVWGWCLPRPKKEGKGTGPFKLNADLAGIDWTGRRVTIVFDSDLATNPNVAAAEQRLAEVLRELGAEVRVARLPSEPDGSKNGLDDYLARRGTDALRDILAAAAPAGRTEEAPADPTRYTDSGYTTDRGRTYHCVLARDKDSGELREEKRTKLANFTARIVGETVHDDGAEQTREFAVAVEQWVRPAVTAGVPVERFGSLDWVVERFGPRYVIQAGSSRKDHLRCAVQEMSGDDIPSATVYRHIGWREVGGSWVYLYAGGAVGAGATRVEVRLDGAAAGFRLPPPPAGDELRDAVRASLGILDGLVTDAVAIPLLATVYRAPLGPADYALWLSGPTGSQKSELAALAQQHYGPGMNRSRLPGNWASTDNALEGLAFTVKDAVLVVDDFAPSVSRNDADRQNRTAERLVRGQGNHAGRQRMRADGTLRPPKPPRGLIMATGEDLPRGHSIAARLCVAEVRRGGVNLARLTACQRDGAAGQYAAAMSGYVAWLAPQYAKVRAGLDAERAALRDQFVGKYPHARTPDVVANLMTGLRYLLQFAEAVGAIDERRQEELSARGLAALRGVAEQQGEHQRAADPVARFPEMVAAVVSSGRGHLAGADGREPGIPPSPEAWGWEGRESGSGPGATHRARGRKIGWVAGEELYLDPESAYAALVELARDQGQCFPVTPQTLFRGLKEAGLLLRTDTDRTTYPATLEGRRRRVLILSAASVFPRPGQPGHAGHGPPNAGESVPDLRPGSGSEDAKPGQETGTNPPEMRPGVPAVPPVPVPPEGGGTGENSHPSNHQPNPDEEVFAL